MRRRLAARALLIAIQTAPMPSNTSTIKQALPIVFTSEEQKAVRPPVTDVFWAATTQKVNLAGRPTATKLVLDISSRSSQQQGMTASQAPTRNPISLRTALTSMKLNTTRNGHVQTRARGPGSVASTTIIGVATGVTVALIISVILILICCFRGRRRKSSVSSLSTSLPQPQVPEPKSFDPNSSTRSHPGMVTSSEQRYIVWKDDFGTHHSSYLSLPQPPPPPDAHPALHRSGSTNDTPPLFLKPPSRPQSRLRTQNPVYPAFLFPSMPGQCSLPPQYPPPQTPPRPPCSSSEPFKIFQNNRESAPLPPSWRAALSLYGSDAGDSRTTTSTSVYSFFPGAGRHSLREGFIPISSLSSAAPNSPMTGHSGEVVVHFPSISPGAEIPPPTAGRKHSVQRIEEEDPSVSSANSSILDYDATQNTPSQKAGRRRPASLSPKQKAQTDSTPRSFVQDCVNSPPRHPCAIGIALSSDIGTEQRKFPTPSSIEFRGSGISKIPSSGIRSDDSQSCRMPSLLPLAAIT
jgi:hypothetical protein